MTTTTYYSAKITQSGMEVARVSGRQPELVEREINRYAALYREEGAIEIHRSRALSKWLNEHHII